MSDSERSARKAVSGKASTGFSAEERAAMKGRARELKAEAAQADGERAVLDRIGEMTEPDRSTCERLRAIIKANAPGLSPKTWYGMPAYANKDGKVICFFRGTQKFSERYLTLGFNQEAKLDDGAMWPIVFALKELTAEVEVRIAVIVKKAVS